MAKQQQSAKKDVSRISFRLLDDDVAMELSRRAQAAGTSRHDLARELVSAGLSVDDHPTEQLESNRLLEEISQLRSELKSIKELPSEAVRDVAEEIDQGIGAELRALRTDVIKFTAQISQSGDEAGIEQVLDELDELKGGLKGVQLVANTVLLLRSDILTSTHILLVHAGDLTPEEARSWVQNTLAGSKHNEGQREPVAQETRKDRHGKVHRTAPIRSSFNSSQSTERSNKQPLFVDGSNSLKLIEKTRLRQR